MTLYVPAEQMRDKLLSLDDLREQLSKTEPLTPVTFSTSEGPFLTYEKGWCSRDLTDPAPVYLSIPGGERYQLTYQAAQELGSACHIPRKLQEFWSPGLLQTVVNRSLADLLPDLELKLLCAGTGKDPDGSDIPLAVALCRASVSPFSNLRLLEAVTEGIWSKYGSDSEVLCDYKLQNDLEATAFRLIIPGASRAVEGTSEADDTWSAGIQVKNSAIGLKQTFTDGYLFRWVCTNGQIDVAHSSGGFRRSVTKNEEEVYEWAREAVDEILEGIESHTMDAVQSLTSQPVERQVVPLLRDLFSTAKLPKREQTRVLEGMADSDGELTMYDVVNAVTQVANSDDLSWQSREHLMTMGGFIIHTAGSRCGNCQRLLPPDWTPPEASPDSAELNLAKAA